LRKNAAIDEELAELALVCKRFKQHRSETARARFDQERGAASAASRQPSVYPDKAILEDLFERTALSQTRQDGQQRYACPFRWFHHHKSLDRVENILRNS
jgi:hypothetical protein